MVDLSCCQEDNRAWAFVAHFGGNTVLDSPVGPLVGPSYYLACTVVVVGDMAVLGIQHQWGMAGDASDSSGPSEVHDYYAGSGCMVVVAEEDTCSYSFD